MLLQSLPIQARMLFLLVVVVIVIVISIFVFTAAAVGDFPLSKR
jgi:hypothetical protein